MNAEDRVGLRSDVEQFVTRFRLPPCPLDGNWYFSRTARLFEPTAAQLHDCLREFGRLLTCALTPYEFWRVLQLQKPVRIVRLGTQAFTERLVKKFDLPVNGWRGDRRP